MPQNGNVETVSPEIEANETHAALRREIRQLVCALDENPETLSQRVAVVDRMNYDQLNAVKSDLLHLQRLKNDAAALAKKTFASFDRIAAAS